jgi:ornithine cyclodeaminase/alanine dehydrogenase-like protein (mu-crystallin family)
VLYLDESDVERLLPSVEGTIGTMEAALVALGNGLADQAPKVGLHPGDHALFHALPVMSSGLGVAGVKWVSYNAANAARGIAGSSAVLIVNDYETGLPVCLLQALALTRARTAACAALAARHLSRSDARVLTLIGGGPVAQTCARYLSEAIPGLEEVHVTTRGYATGHAAAAVLTQAIPQTVRAHSDVGDAIADADIVVSAIGHPETPPLRSEWLREGMLALPLEGEAAWETGAFLRADRVIADDANVLREGFARNRPDDPPPEVHAELSAVIAGHSPGRSYQEERIIDSNNGIGILDLALGQVIYQRALEQGVGLQL